MSVPTVSLDSKDRLPHLDTMVMDRPPHLDTVVMDRPPHLDTVVTDIPPHLDTVVMDSKDMSADSGGGLGGGMHTS